MSGQPVFEPPPGSELSIAAPAWGPDGPNQEDVRNWSGHISVDPGPGGCVVLTTGVRRRDNRVCARRQVPFFLGDIESDGSVRWQVAQDAQSRPLEFVWPTRYRVGLRLGGDRRRQSLFILGCQLLAVPGRERIRIAVGGEADWELGLPQDKKYVRLPSTRDRVFLRQTIAAMNKKLMTRSEIKARVGAALQARRLIAQQFVHPEARAYRSLKWQTSLAGAHVLPVEGVRMGSANFSASDGRCILAYHGFRADARIGVVECVHVTAGRRLVIPLVCLRQDSDPLLASLRQARQGAELFE